MVTIFPDTDGMNTGNFGLYLLRGKFYLLRAAPLNRDKGLISQAMKLNTGPDISPSPQASFAVVLEASEEWLIDRILAIARQRNYIRYTSTLREAWRLSIASLSEQLLGALAICPEIPELSPDTDFAASPGAAFAVEEARRHRARGIDLSLFLGLMKYYRQSYVDLVDERSEVLEDAQWCRRFVDRFFDRIEICFCAAWAEGGEDERIDEMRGANRHLANEKNKYLTIFESLAPPVILLDTEGRVDNLNFAAARLFRKSAIPGSAYYGGENEQGVFAWLEEELEAFLPGEGTDLVLEKSLEDGDHELVFEVRLQRMLDVSGKFTGIAVTLNDITARKASERAVRERDSQYHALFENNHSVMLLIDPASGAIVDANPAACTFYGYDHAALTAMNIDQVNTLDREELRIELERARGEEKRVFHFRHRRCDGEVRDVEVFSGPIRVRGRGLLYSIVHDVTERRRLQDEIWHQANYDALTGLPNRSLFFDRLGQAIAQARRNGSKGALLFIDLDHFKAVNDTHGHAGGDQLLREAARRLAACVRQSDTVARMGGDEFTVLLAEAAEEEAVEEACRRILQQLSRPFEVSGQEARVSGSVGIALFPLHGEDPAVLLQRADMAMYTAKEKGRNGVWLSGIPT